MGQFIFIYRFIYFFRGKGKKGGRASGSGRDDIYLQKYLEEREINSASVSRKVRGKTRKTKIKCTENFRGRGEIRRELFYFLFFFFLL